MRAECFDPGTHTGPHNPGGNLGAFVAGGARRWMAPPLETIACSHFGGWGVGGLKSYFRYAVFEVPSGYKWRCLKNGLINESELRGNVSAGDKTLKPWDCMKLLKAGFSGLTASHRSFSDEDLILLPRSHGEWGQSRWTCANSQASQNPV